MSTLPFSTRVGACVVTATLASALIAAQRTPEIPRANLPAGVGIAQVTPKPGLSLHFYRAPRLGQTPADVEPMGTVIFGPGQPSVDIAAAPPWLAPDHLKLDYEIFYLRVITLTRDWIEVIGNTRTGETHWIARDAAQFIAWPEFLLSVHSVQAVSSTLNPVRTGPLDSSPILSSAPGPLPPLAIQGEWMKVAPHELADRMPPEGWIRWRRGDRLLITYNPLS